MPAIWTTLWSVGEGLWAAQRRMNARLMRVVSEDAGMSTVEYAIGTIAAAAFGAVLYTVVTGESIPDALTGIIEKALNTSV
ncbi:hypothetical protein GCM10011588_55620 [Nocardia jinanensis]|uniref:DUF4244 domain-containing protein n=2 Tax=Nocardia jinanensis TaxID=382504 RepID=A0A917VWM0_9NOCA|nr:hypothetical protein GCM10011588_55620 [Nocardia jinanensis]